MKKALKKFKNPILVILISFLVILSLNSPLFAQSGQVLNKPSEVNIDFPRSNAPFGGFICTFDKTGTHYSKI